MTRTLALLLLVPACAAVHAAEGFRLRQPSVSMFGGEMGRSIDPGPFVAATATYTAIRGVAGADGNPLTVAARTVPLPTGAPTGGAVRDGTYSLQVPPGPIELRQVQKQVNLAGGYVFDGVAGGSVALRANLPLIDQSRSFRATQATGTIVPTPAAPLPAPAIAAVNAVGAAANAQVQSGLVAQGFSQNANAGGLGDLELSAAWLRTYGPWRVGAAYSLYLPTGDYSTARGPNPGFGDFLTHQAGVAFTYAAAGQPGPGQWAPGWAFSGRAAVGTNGTNRYTGVRSGNFTVLEAAVLHRTGNWSVGANVLALRQTSDDTLNGTPVAASRLRLNAAGPFVTIKLPWRDLALNVHANSTFGERNALIARSLQMRLVGAF